MLPVTPSVLFLSCHMRMQVALEEQLRTLQFELASVQREAELKQSSLEAWLQAEARQRAQAEARVDEFFRAYTATQAQVLVRKIHLCVHSKA